MRTSQPSEKVKMRYYIISGEASGDLHASNLLKAIKMVDPNAEFRGWGGDRMEDQGAVIVKHYRDLAFMGFVEVVMNLKQILRNLNICKTDIIRYKPDVVILIDYPGFNLRIAKFLKKQGIKVVYYISPQIWAWKKSRVHTIKKVVNKVLVILPFEKQFYENYGVDSEFVGHPLLDEITNKHYNSNFTTDGRSVVALLPGSRKQEIKSVLPIMLSVADDLPDVDFVIAGVSSLGLDFYESFTSGHNVRIVFNRTYDLLSGARAALVTSGTATLETAIIGTPEVVCYRAGWISYSIAKRLIKVRFISLVNLIMDKLVVRELIQSDLNQVALYEELNALLYNEKYRENMLSNYNELRLKLGGDGASYRAAQVIYSLLNT